MCYTATDLPVAFVWPSVPSCREITSNLCANQRISRRPDSRLPLLRSILGFFGTPPCLFSHSPCLGLPILFVFNFVSYILSLYSGPRRLVFFVRETVLLNRLRVPSSRPGVSSFSSFSIFHISVVRSKLLGCFNRSLGLQQYR